MEPTLHSTVRSPARVAEAAGQGSQHSAASAMGPDHWTPERLARVTGLLYLLLAVFGMYSPIVLETLAVPGDAAATAANIRGSLWVFGSSLVAWIVIVAADVAISVTLYLLLRPVSHTLSLVASAFRIVYSAMLAAVLVSLFDAFLLLTSAERVVGLGTQQAETMAMAALDSFSRGFSLALIFFGTHLLGLGALLYHSRMVPRVFGLLLVAAGVGYVIDSLAKVFIAGHSEATSLLLLTPALLGELGLTVWLLVKGIKTSRVETTAHL